jgi:DNA repair exonuclease SbcCD ATPase subunit
MGLYINHNNHEGIFENKEDIAAFNQRFFMKNHVEEMIQSQQKVNVSMEKAIRDIGLYQKQQEGKQQEHWMEMQQHFQQLLMMNTKYEEMEGRVMEKLLLLEEKNEQLSDMVKKSDSSEKEKMEGMYAFQQKLLSQIEGYETEVQQLIGKIDKQTDLYRQLTEKVDEQENTREEVLDRLDNQEALTEKLLRQFEHFRSALFERTSFLAEKIEESAKITSVYMTKLLPGKDRSTTLYK